MRRVAHLRVFYTLSHPLGIPYIGTLEVSNFGKCAADVIFSVCNSTFYVVHFFSSMGVGMRTSYFAFRSRVEERKSMLSRLAKTHWVHHSRFRLPQLQRMNYVRFVMCFNGLPDHILFDPKKQEYFRHMLIKMTC